MKEVEQNHGSYRQLLFDKRWLERRAQIIERDNYCCRICGSKDNLPSGYNRLNFAIMYVPIEGALNLALFNDSTLWREAYDDGVMILGPQTMYMNLRVLEMMWTQVRQLNNQQAMIDAANTIVERVQDFGQRFLDVESSMNDAMKKMSRLKITTADGGPSIITAARNLIKLAPKKTKRKSRLLTWTIPYSLIQTKQDY